MPINRIQAIELGTFNSASLTANFQPIYANGLSHSLAYLRIVNKSNVDIIISYDGITSNDYIVAGDTFILPAQLMSQPRNQVSNIAAGSLLSIKQATAAGVGLIYISGY